MAKKIRSFMCTLTAAICGMTTFALYPNSNYTQYVTTPEQMMRLTWHQTGQRLKTAIDKVGRDYKNDELSK